MLARLGYGMPMRGPSMVENNGNRDKKGHGTQPKASAPFQCCIGCGSVMSVLTCFGGSVSGIRGQNKWESYLLSFRSWDALSSNIETGTCHSVPFPGAWAIRVGFSYFPLFYTIGGLTMNTFVVFRHNFEFQI